MAILLIFDFSCVARAAFDRCLCFYIEDKHGYSMASLCCLIFSALFLDLIPICMILIFHSLNFKTLHAGANLQKREQLFSTDIAEYEHD